MDYVALFVVYCNPLDFPGQYVIRRQIVTGQNEGYKIVKDAQPLYVGDSLTRAQAMLIARGLYRMNRDPDDDPAILEVWI